MSGGRALSPQHPELVTDGPPSPGPHWLELVTSSDHKDVGRIMIGASLSFLVLGLVAYLLMRLQLAVPENDLIAPITFNRLLSVGSASLIVLFALPFVMGLYTYVVPLQIGARSLAFPRLANFALWLYLGGGFVLFASFAYTPPEAGFNAWPPLSDTVFISNNGVDVWITAVGLTVLGMLLLAINLAVTVWKLRAPGLAWRRLPPFSVSAVVSSWTLVVAASAMLAALTMLEMQRHFGAVFFDPGEGGAPIYYQHLSWVFFNGCYVLFLLPAIGAISEILPAFTRKPLLSRGAVVGSMTAIAVLGLLAWMQNMFSASIPIGWLYMAMAAALLITVPVALILINWLATIAGGALRPRAPARFAIASIFTLTFGLGGELALSVIPVNWLLGDTAASTALSGYVLVGGPVLGGLAALYYWFPKMTGRTMGETLGRLSVIVIVLGAQLTFVPMFLAGVDSQPTEIYKYYDVGNLDLYNLLTTIGAFVLAGGIIVSLANAILSVTRGPRAGHDPWEADTLEWFATSPPPPHNFDVLPDVRSDEPLRDIRDAVSRREAASTKRTESTEPVA